MFRLLILVIVAGYCMTGNAADKKELGFKLDVTVKGFFSPEVTTATVKSVTPDSLAETLGVRAGDRLISIVDCKIPGCPASVAKDYISQDIGTKVTFEFISEAGTNYTIAIPLQ